MQQFHYSAQVRNWLIQLIRMFSEFSVQYGVDGNGNIIYHRVPVRYADASMQVANIQRSNSTNSIPEVPLMGLYINGLKPNAKRRQDPTLIDTKQIRTRDYDPVTHSYLPTQANAYSVKRIMPVPYDLSIKVDIWSSNTTQKLQLLEQLLPLFNPALEIQSNDRYIDWTSLSYVELTDVNWTSKSFPTPIQDPVDVATLEFLVPIWLTLPAHVTKQNVIFKVVNSIFDEDGNLCDGSEFIDAENLLLGTRQCVTFNDYNIYVLNGQIQLLYSSQRVNVDSTVDPGTVEGATVDWNTVLDKYGKFVDGVSQIRLTYDNSGLEIVGTGTVNPTNSYYMIYNVDSETLPVDTLPSINGIVNPQEQAPGINGLPAAVTGQRYLLSSNVGDGSDTQHPTGWFYGGVPLVANINDIIQFNGTSWFVSFQASANPTMQFVTDLSNELQYRWTGTGWAKGWEGEYMPINWRIVL
jgi:hypothetical protein